MALVMKKLLIIYNIIMLLINKVKLRSFIIIKRILFFNEYDGENNS